MDIQQQTKNVAAQGRFGDSMLLHVNPAEVKGLASAVPLTVNPETGQPEAFLPFLAPVLGSMLAPTLLASTGLSAGAMAGIGAGLATYAQTGGSGSKALLSGLTAGLGTSALSGGAEAAVGADAATQAATTGADIATQTAARDAAISAAQEGAKLTTEAGFRGFTPGESLKTMFGDRGLDAGMQSLAGAAMRPTGMLAGTAAGTAGVIASQEEFERQMAQMGLDEEERKKRMYEMYPEQIPMAEGGRTGFRRGGESNGSYDPIEDIYGTINNNFNAYSTPPRRTTRPITPGFMPGFMPEYSYFSGINPSATSLGYDPLGTTSFSNYGQPRQSRGRSRGMQPMQPPGGFREEGGYGFMPPPMFGGYGNPFMQSPSYQGFYGVPQMQQMINPYAAFSQMPMPYQPYQPPQTPPPSDGGDTPPPGDGSETPPDDSGITPPPNDGGGRKGSVFNPDPISPPDDFVSPIVNPPVGRPVEPPINVPGGTPGFYDRPQPMPIEVPKPVRPIIEPINTPPPTITIPIEGGADVTIPDFSRPQPPKLEPPMSIDRIGNYDLDRRFGEVPVNVQPAPAVPEPVAPPAIVQPPVITPSRIEPPMKRPEPPMSIGGPGGGNMTGREELALANANVGDIKPPKIMSSTPIKTTREALGPVDTRDYASMSDDEIKKLIPQIGYGVGANRKTVPISQARIDEFRLEKTDPQLFSQLMKDLSSGNALPENYTNPIAKQMAERDQASRAKFAEFQRNNPVIPPVAPPPPDGTPENPFAMQPVKTPFVPVTTPPAQLVTTPQPSIKQPMPMPISPPRRTAPPVLGGRDFLPKEPDLTPVQPPQISGGFMPQPAPPSAQPVPSIGFTPPAPTVDTGNNSIIGRPPSQATFTPPSLTPNQGTFANQPKPPMSSGIFGAPMFAEGGDTDKELPNEGLKALAKTEKGREAVEAMGYQEGGQTDMMQDPITQNVIMFILGETDDENAINMFVEKYGSEQFMFLRDKILKQAAGNPDAQTEGLIQGNGNSGMADDLPMNIGKFAEAAVSQDEYIIPADVVSMLGDGSSDAGSKQLDGMLDRVRQAKTGGKTQAPPLNPNKVMPA